MTDTFSPKPPGLSARAAVRKGAVGQPRRPSGWLPQQEDARRCRAARRRGRGADAPGGGAGASLGDPTAMRLCIERILPPCRERTVKFALPPIESAADIAPAMKAVTSALAAGVDHAGRGGDDRGGGRHLCPGDRDQRLRAAPEDRRRRACRSTRTCARNVRHRTGRAIQSIGESLL